VGVAAKNLADGVGSADVDDVPEVAANVDNLAIADVVGASHDAPVDVVFVDGIVDDAADDDAGCADVACTARAANARVVVEGISCTGAPHVLMK
jgi:hypothetical protein